MSYDRRPDRRPGGGRPPGGRPGGGRPDRPPRDRDSFAGPPRDRGGFGQRPPQRGGFERPTQDRPAFDRPPQDRGFAPRGRDEGGMSLRLDPRRLAALKLLAAEGGLRPGELVTKWVEERLDAARMGMPAATPQAAGAQLPPAALAELSARIDELAGRVDTLSRAQATPLAAIAAAGSDPADVSRPVTGTQPAKRRGRPPKAKGTVKGAGPGGPRIALHDEIAAVIGERGPLTAGELASAIVERGRYTAPRSAKPLDATTISARVSNPIYRPRFVRNKGRISLANAG